jgi:hypothetical protein
MIVTNDAQKGRAVAKAVRLRLLNAEAHVSSWVISCEICSRQSGTGTGSSPSISLVPF